MPSSTTDTQNTASADVAVMTREIFPVFLKAIQAIAVGDPNAEQLTQGVLQLLERNAEEAGEESKELWTAALALGQTVLIERPGPMALIDYVERLEQHPEVPWQLLCAMCYLGASVDQRTIPSLAIGLHMTVAEFLYDETHEIPELYEPVILPWFAAFWTRIFEKARFRFHSARIVETEMKTALESEPQLRLQRLLGAVGFGLDVVLPDEGREWFKV